MTPTKTRILIELDRISSTVNIIRRELVRLDGCYDNDDVNKDLLRQELEFYGLL